MQGNTITYDPGYMLTYNNPWIGTQSTMGYSGTTTNTMFTYPTKGYIDSAVTGLRLNGVTIAKGGTTYLTTSV